ncbi:unannotated protein [freshwater metagenome]|uniref:Unannotated protein n=1 Tax=freshwater metagenome TaxID=449393 RepID=A0A6J5ZBA0_9ZZZZ
MNPDTADMKIVAAAVTTPTVLTKPSLMALSLSLPISQASLIRDTIKIS